jgi:hypothetical protein
MHKALTALGVFALAATAALAQAPGRTTFTETFDGGSNVGGWTFGNTFFELIEDDGGNPGAFYRNTFLDTFAPQATTTATDSPFTGNYRLLAVQSLSVDLAVFHVDFSSAGRNISLLLTNDGGTPDDFSDDCTVYKIGKKVGPDDDGTWKSYAFEVPAKAKGLPDGWGVLGLTCPGHDLKEAWKVVTSDVDRVTFFFGDPTLFYIFQVWDIGMDNPTITWGRGGPAGPAE